MPRAPGIHEWLLGVRSEEVKEDIVDGLIADGDEITLLAGRPGTGKTNICLYLALCLATGTPFFGFATKRVEVTYLGFEGARTKLADRLEKIMKSFHNPHSYFHFDKIKPTKIDDKLIERIKGSKVVIIDPLRYLVEGDFCRPQDASNFIIKLKEVAANEKLTWVLSHHIRKPQSGILIDKDDIYQLKGATEYVDVATTVLLLERTKHKPGPKTQEQQEDSYEGYTLYFAKARDAINEIPPMKLRFDREKLIYFKVEGKK